MDFWGAQVWDKISYYYKDFVLFKIQDVGITLSHLVVAMVAVLLSLLISKILRSMLQKQVFDKMDMDEGLKYALSRFLHYLILILGIYIGLTTVNIPLGAVIGLFAVIGVGIGFGLQNMASNFISGVILLLERPIKIGDRLEVGDVWGDVKRINLRTTLIQTPDHISIIVPNSILLENAVTNYSYGDARLRLRIPVGIAYGSDCDKATALMIEAAQEHDRVLDVPARKPGSESLAILPLTLNYCAGFLMRPVSSMSSVTSIIRSTGYSVLTESRFHSRSVICICVQHRHLCG